VLPPNAASGAKDDALKTHTDPDLLRIRKENRKGGLSPPFSNVQHFSRFSDRAQHLVELGEGNARRVCAQDSSLSFGTQGGDTEGHGNAVVAVGVDLGAVEALIAGYAQPIGKFFDLGAHGPEALSHGRNAI
jgi:hypothetical protein